MTISEAISDGLLQIANFNKQTYQIRCSFPKPALELTCRDETIARICEIIILNSVFLSSRENSQYKVWNESNKIYFISYRSKDVIGGSIDDDYLLELSEKIVDYLLANAFDWRITSEEVSINFKKQLENSEELAVFEHDHIGIDMINLFAHFLLLQKCPLSRFSNFMLKGKLLILCPTEHMNRAKETIKNIVVKLNSNKSEVPHK